VNKIKILVADDHAIMRDGIRALLDLHDDIEIVGEAANGKEAVEKALQLSPDIVVMDIAMPRMDGLEATRRIRKRKPMVKVLVLTQYDNRKYVLPAIRSGASGYVPKRALGSELVAAIRAMYNEDSFLHPSAAATLVEDYLNKVEEDPFDRLTDKEREILRLIADGYTSRQIADMLFISLKTAQGHRTKIMTKLNIHNRTELIKYAIHRGLVSVDT